MLTASAATGPTAVSAGASRRIPALLWLPMAFDVLFLCINGGFMLVAPKTWYDVIPGVGETGFFNPHFVRDIGIVQLFLGAAFAIGAVRPASRVALWTAATAWLIAHAAFHVWEVAVGICAASALLRDFPAVSLPALIGIVLTAWAWISHQLRGQAARQY